MSEIEQQTGPALEVRRTTLVAAATGAVAAVVGAAYVARATGTASALDWAVAALMLAIAGLHLWTVRDARVPLFVADDLGVRLRQGRTWRGLPWTDIEAVEVLPRRRWRDGAVDVLAGEGDPISVPLSVSTRVVGVHGDQRDVVDALADLAGERTEVVEIDGYEYVDDADWAAARTEDETPVEPDVAVETQPVDRPDDRPVDQPEPTRRLPDLRPRLAHVIDAVATRLPSRGADPAPTVGTTPLATATPSPLREPVTAVRAEIRTDLSVTQPVIGATALRLDRADDETHEGRTDLPEARELRRPGSVSLVEDTMAWGERVLGRATERVRPIAQEGSPVEPISFEDDERPALDPVIGPELAAARTRLGLGVDQLADRTRIRPHVIEAIEVDDFAPCGGDFYARGHLRTLARVLGVDVAPLLAHYDERYADAPINPRRVFEAELGQGGAIRGTRGGPQWSVLIAAVMALVLCWSIARLVMDSPVALRDPIPSLSTSASTTTGAKVPVVLTAAGGGAEVVVRDGANELVYKGTLSFGEVKVLPKVSQPVRVQSSDGSLEVTLDGASQGALGRTGQPAQNTFVAR